MKRRQDTGPAPARPLLPIAVAALALIAFVVLAVGDIVTTSPTSDELPHLASGYTYLTRHDYRLNNEHPPLLKEWAALPIVSLPIWPVLNDRLDRAWESALEVPNAQWSVAHELFYGRRDPYVNTPTTQRIPRSAFINDAEALFTRGRLMMLFFPLLLGVIIFAWAAELWGWWGGTLAAALFAFDPNFIAHGGLITTDAGVAALMAAAIYFFWRCSRRGSAWNIAAFAVFFALALVAKYSALLLLPMIAILFFHARGRKTAIAIAVAAVVTFIVIWGLYGFRYAATAEKPRPIVMVVNDWYAARSLLDQFPNGPPESEIQRARPTVHIGLLGRAVLALHEFHIVPEAYLYGFTLMERNSYARWSFLRGEGSHTGFATYFFWTFLYKTPEAAIAAIVIGLIALRRRRTPALPFLLWPIVIYMAVSMASSLNIGHRHILPVYPFLYVIAGSVAMTWWNYEPRKRVISGVIAAIAIALPALIVPAPMWGRHLAFMNSIAGGPWHGYEKLIDSNFDWGQDLKRLGAWAGGRTEPINLVYFGTADPRFYGIPYRNLPYGYGMDPSAAPDPSLHDFVISTSALQGVNADVDTARGYWKKYLAEHHGRVVGRVGYSILLYRID